MKRRCIITLDDSGMFHASAYAKGQPRLVGHWEAYKAPQVVWECLAVLAPRPGAHCVVNLDSRLLYPVT